jgi:hypothetical protein
MGYEEIVVPVPLRDAACHQAEKDLDSRRRIQLASGESAQ